MVEMEKVSIKRTLKGRAVSENTRHRFETTTSEAIDDGWWQQEELSDSLPVKTSLIKEHSKTIISNNQSPDVPFEQSINPYRGCEHGCVYCYARPSHAFWDLSPGLDFESKIIYKANAIELLEKKFNSPSYQCKPITIGANTDAYQPVERKLKITRQILQLMLDYQHPVSIITKGQLIGRDLDLLAKLADKNLVSVAVSVTTLENSLKRILEPRTASPTSRLEIIRKLSEKNIPVTALIAPIIPAINDGEIEKMIHQVSLSGATRAAYILLRLPYELKAIFGDWLDTHFPQRKEKVLNYLREMRGGKLNEQRFGRRMSGDGIYAQLINRRFHVACQKFGIEGLHGREGDIQSLNTSLFRSDQPKQFDLL
ncbi:PA0069 family radical SAM protein [Aliikangiella coralliicola]|uniref:PA0069 family radical SAM protein n=1 Tax=Aliikangiella coralliicola TaxID=2592383 RepID=A0A545UCE4_9GAMM|nr:PA0069 family radical SAM protein [Aliikangiella coralliicola]TQV87141.1 PA0069 family radical SAM protein [Aliikangiella coralliicola]